ncbi:hypothetical protein IVB22_32335 [Bradyrhizobium sp. 190]|uniref:hypothetical protein n=1 Tax=Bradyrhizobium sp. 190 TaxID=2782658 RepID=UPI001FFA22B4|nr:hypothetical protein [Bradyrhizobium sp. 190]MCK1517111.1 hypothetical protein [Bradyrhizobium sp. 190]
MSESGGTNPAYVDGLQAGLREAESSVGAATPPHAAGLSAASGETPPGRESAPNSPADSFTELWNAFNLKLTNTKPKAKAAYEKLSPDAGLHAAMVEAAARLHAHYEEHATERRYRIQCHNWINARGWEDDLPIVYADAKGAAISKTRGSAKPTPGKPATGKAAKPGCAFPAGETCITITESILSETHTSGMLIITGNDEAGEEYIHTVPVKHHKEEVQNAGQKEKDSIVTAAGFFFQIDDPANLIGRRIVALVDGGELTWHEPSGGQPEPEPELVEPPPPKRRMTIEEQQAEYDAWFEAQLEDKAA